MNTETPEQTEVVPEVVPDATPLEEIAPATAQVAAAAPFWQKLLHEPGKAMPITIGAAILVLSAAAGFGARWALEPGTAETGGLGEARKKIASLTAEAASARAALLAAQDAAQKASHLSERQAVEQAAKQAPPQSAVVAQGAPLLNVHSSATVVSRAGATGKPVKTMECDLTGSKEKIAQSLKACVLQFDGMNR